MHCPKLPNFCLTNSSFHFSQNKSPSSEFKFTLPLFIIKSCTAQNLALIHIASSETRIPVVISMPLMVVSRRLDEICSDLMTN